MTDVLDDQAIQNLVDVTLDAHGRIDILVNNVGVAHTKPALEISKVE